MEQTYDIKRLLLWDAKSIDATATNMNAYQIYISEETPNLSLITKSGDTNTCWTQVADKKSTGSLNKKIVSFATPIRGRYVKLVFPRTSAGMNNADQPALYAFHIYGTLAEDVDAIGQIPNANPSDKDDEAIYTLSGIKVEKGKQKPELYIKSGQKVLLR